MLHDRSEPFDRRRNSSESEQRMAFVHLNDDALTFPCERDQRLGSAQRMKCIVKLGLEEINEAICSRLRAALATHLNIARGGSRRCANDDGPHRDAPSMLPLARWSHEGTSLREDWRRW